MHTDDVVPYVLCQKCGSQDTRKESALSGNPPHPFREVIEELAALKELDPASPESTEDNDIDGLRLVLEGLEKTSPRMRAATLRFAWDKYVARE